MNPRSLRTSGRLWCVAWCCFMVGCASGQRSGTERTTESASRPAASAGDVRASATVTAECPPSVTEGELTAIRSSHTWTVENGTANRIQYVVVLELSDDLGHAKKKEVPGQAAAGARVEDSTSIALTTTYDRDGQPVRVEARTRVLLGENELASVSGNCGFKP